MALHDDLLSQAQHLARRNYPNPNEADLRRAVSSAYYALFHLLISEACANWSRAETRADLARMFEHSYMKRVSKRITDVTRTPYAEEDPAIVLKLRSVAGIFVELQDKRHEADYDTARTWSFTQAMKEVLSVARAFADWNEIREEMISQEYLVSLLIKPRE